MDIKINGTSDEIQRLLNRSVIDLMRNRGEIFTINGYHFMVENITHYSTDKNIVMLEKVEVLNDKLCK